MRMRDALEVTACTAIVSRTSALDAASDNAVVAVSSVKIGLPVAHEVLVMIVLSGDTETVSSFLAWPAWRSRRMVLPAMVSCVSQR